VNAAMNLLVLQNAGKVVTSKNRFSFSRRTLLHGLSELSN